MDSKNNINTHSPGKEREIRDDEVDGSAVRKSQVQLVIRAESTTGTGKSGSGSNTNTNTNSEDSLRVNSHITEQPLQKATRKSTPSEKMFQILSLAFAITGGALVGPISIIMPCEGIFLKMTWRFHSLIFLLIIWIGLEKLYSKWQIKHDF